MKMSWLGPGAAALCMALAAPATMAGEQCSLSGLEIPVTMIGTRAVATIGINGQQVPFTVDSGAFFSMITPSAADELHLRRRELPFGMRVEGLTGEIKSYLTVVDKVKLPGGEIPDVEFIVGGNEIGSGTRGLLGRNFLSMADIEYDLAHGMIRLIFPRGDCREDQYAYWAGSQPVVDVPLLRDNNDPKRPALRTAVQINGTDLRVLLDTGASSTLSLSAALKAGVGREQMRPAGRMRGAGEGSAEAWIAPLQRFAIGGEEVRNVRMLVSDISKGDYDMLLGIDFFLAHRIYISKSSKRLYFTHNGGPVFAFSPVEKPASSPAASPAVATDDASMDADAYLRRGAASASRRDYGAALADLDRACTLAPDRAEAFVRRSAVHVALRHRAEALSDLDTALKIEPTQPEALLLRARLRLPAEREAAKADLKTLDGAISPQAPARLQMAELYINWNLQQEALTQWAYWIAAHKTDANLPEVLNSRCWVRMRMGIDLDAALEDCKQAVEADSKNAAYLDSRAWLRLRRAELQDALADFDAALKLKPEQAMSLYGRSIVRERLGAPGQSDLEAARKLRPQIETEARKQGLPVPG